MALAVAVGFDEEAWLVVRESIFEVVVAFPFDASVLPFAFPAFGSVEARIGYVGFRLLDGNRAYRFQFG